MDSVSKLNCMHSQMDTVQGCFDYNLSRPDTESCPYSNALNFRAQREPRCVSQNWGLYYVLVNSLGIPLAKKLFNRSHRQRDSFPVRS